MYCEKCGTLMGTKKLCPYCNRLGKDEEEPPVAHGQWVMKEFKVCPKCGGKMKVHGQYALCYECRRNNAPLARAETEYDEIHPPSE